MTTAVTHVVAFRMKPEFDAKVEAAAAAKAAEFVGSIPGVVSVSFGRSFTTEFAQGFTHMLVVVMDHPDRLAGYGPHPTHQAWAGAFMTPFKLDILKLDIDAVVTSGGGKM